MPGRSPVVGAVLCGGASRRMGRDKALLEVGSRSLIERAAAALAAVLGEVVLASGTGAAYPLLGLPEVADRHPGKGPLAGLDAALAHAAGGPVFALACDLPFVGEELVRHLAGPEALAALGDGAAARVPFLDGRPQPLCALYAGGCLEPVARRLAAGSLRAMDLLDDLAVDEVALTPELPFYRTDLLDNVNRPTDLERAARAAR